MDKQPAMVKVGTSGVVVAPSQVVGSNFVLNAPADGDCKPGRLIQKDFAG
jgi:hypothetical protein